MLASCIRQTTMVKPVPLTVTVSVGQVDTNYARAGATQWNQL